MVGRWSIGGQYVVSMWLVSGWYVVERWSADHLPTILRCSLFNITLFQESHRINSNVIILGHKSFHCFLLVRMIFWDIYAVLKLGWSQMVWTSFWTLWHFVSPPPWCLCRLSNPLCLVYLALKDLLILPCNEIVMKKEWTTKYWKLTNFTSTVCWLKTWKIRESSYTISHLLQEQFRKEIQEIQPSGTWSNLAISCTNSKYQFPTLKSTFFYIK